MTPETRDRMKRLVDSVAGEVTGGLSFDKGAAGLLRGLDVLRSHFESVDSEAKVLEILDAIDEPTPQQIHTIEAMASLVPMVLTGLIRNAMESAVAAMPGEKTGRKATTMEEKTEMCNRVSELVRSGCPLTVAKKRVGISTGKSLRTVNRIWCGRAGYVSGVGPDQVLEMIKALIYGDDASATRSSVEKLLERSE